MLPGPSVEKTRFKFSLTIAKSNCKLCLSQFNITQCSINHIKHDLKGKGIVND